MVIEGQRLAPVLAALVVGLVSWPGEQAPTLSPAKPAVLQSSPGPRLPSPVFPSTLRDPFQRTAPRTAPAKAAAVPEKGRAVALAPKLRLPPITGLILGQRRRVVFFGHDAVVEGESFRGARVARVESRGVQLEIRGSRLFVPFPGPVSAAASHGSTRLMEVVR